MRPRTRTQCQDGPPSPIGDGAAASSAAGADGDVGASASSAANASASDASSSGSSSGVASKDDAVFAVPTTAALPGTSSRRSYCESLLGAAGPSCSSSKASSSASEAGGSRSDEGSPREMLLVELPAEVLVKILGYLPYNNVSGLRPVSRRFNELCASVLNSTFQRQQSAMLQRFQAVKAKMPRRESARRNHPLARESDIVETIHMRLSLLQMTFGKHVERKHVCFFAGEILDEVDKIMRYIKATPNLARAYRVTDELCDLCTMAMEYFKEKIEPTLPEITHFGTDFFDFATPYSAPGGGKRRMQSGQDCSSRASVAGSSCSEPWAMGMQDEEDDDLLDEDEEDLLPSSAAVARGAGAGGSGRVGGGGGFAPLRSGGTGSNVLLRKRVRKLKQGVKKHDDELSEVRSELKAARAKVESQAKQVGEFTRRMDDYDKKFEDSDRKIQAVLAELNKCKTELHFWKTKAVVMAAANASSSSVDTAAIDAGDGAAPSSSLGPAAQELLSQLSCCKCDGPITVEDLEPASAVTEDEDEGDDEDVVHRVLRSGPPSPAASGQAVQQPPASRKRKAASTASAAASEEGVTRKSLRGAGVKNRNAKNAAKKAAAN